MHQKLTPSLLGVLIVGSMTFGCVTPSARCRGVTEARDVFAVFSEDGGLMASEAPLLILALWSDGTMVWSADQSRGGPPYRTGNVGPAAFSELAKYVLRNDALGDSRLRRSWAPWDAPFTTILIRSGGRELRMRSDHDLNGLSPEESGSHEMSEDYRAFRVFWDDVRREALALIPDDGASVDGYLSMKRGSITWRDRHGCHGD